MLRITISYRRDDSLDITGRIFDRLAGHFGREAVFRDIDSIPPGTDFRRHIDVLLDKSDIILAIVGPRWIGPNNEQLRLANPADPVRLEIETALRKDKPLIPVLVSRAVMPQADVLPASLHGFVYRHAVQVDSGQDFDVHVGRLIRAIEERAAAKHVRHVIPAIEAPPSIEPTTKAEPPVDPVAPPVGRPVVRADEGRYTVRWAIALGLVVILGIISVLGIALWTISGLLKGPEVSTLGNQSPGVISGGDATINFGSSPAAQSGSRPANAPNLAPSGAVHTEGAQSPGVVAGGKVGIEFAPTPSAPSAPSAPR
jgi:TIR domain